MATYNDLVNGALRLIGIIGEGETPTSYQSDNALFTLNEMLDSWNADGLMIYTQNFYEYTFVSNTSTVTIGPGGNIDIPVRPSELTAAWIRQNASGNYIDLPMNLITQEEYGNIRAKTSPSTIPRYIALNGDWPVATMYLWPTAIPSDTKLRILCNYPLTTGVALSDTENLPPAYRQAIRFNLACLLAAEYGREAPPTVQQQAYKSKSIIAQNNQSIDHLDFDPLIQGGDQNLWYIVADDRI